MAKIKMLALDLDGTLLNDQREVSKATELKLKEVIAKGIKVVLVSGRPLAGIQPYLQQLGLVTEDQYCLTFNGCMVVNAAGDLISGTFLNYDDFLCLEELANKYEATFHYEIESSYTTSKFIDVAFCKEGFRTRMPARVLELEEVPKDLQFAKGVITVYPYERADEIMSDLSAELFDRFAISHSAEGIIEFTSKLVTKASAIKDFVKKIGFKLEEVAVFGDADNDISMFEEPAFYKVAMGNAIDELKQRANLVTKNNNDDGIVYAVKQLKDQGILNI